MLKEVPGDMGGHPANRTNRSQEGKAHETYFTYSHILILLGVDNHLVQNLLSSRLLSKKLKN
jgi:hypothetical protein